MREILPENLLLLPKNLTLPLYVVGGSVRDFLAGRTKENADWDLAGAFSEDTLLAAAEPLGFTAEAIYRNTGTVRLRDREGVHYEFTRFRSDKYVRGVHAPQEILFTDDIRKDAVRRDFKANAVYYDVGGGEYRDPLGGMEDIQRKLLRTVAPAKKVFGEDGLRLMRLCRLAAETGFSPDEECLEGAAENCALIRDIVPERIFQELLRLLETEDGLGAYRGLTIMKKTGVLKEVLPELALGEGLFQRADFHRYDVLEHTLRCVRYADKGVRFAALFHDVGKPFCYHRDGNFYDHPKEGARIAEEILTRLKAPKRLTEETKNLVLLHMKDYNLQMRENKVRRTIAENAALLSKLLALFQADYSACKDDLSPAPVRVKWQKIFERMKEEGAPSSLKELALKGGELSKLGVPHEKIGALLHELLLFAIEDGKRNQRECLIKHAKACMKNLLT